MEITGTLHKVLPEQKGTGSKGSWIKQEFILKTTGQYPKEVCFSVWGNDKVESLQKHKPGSTIKVHFDPESREYNNRYYTELRAWKIEAQQSETIQENNSEDNQLPF
jgi:hypothetical protein